MDAAKEFPHRDESGTAKTVCCPIFTVWLHWLLHATSATFFRISRYRLPCGNVAGHTPGAQIKRNRCVQFARAAHFEPDATIAPIN